MHLTLVRSDLQLLTRYTDTQDRTALDELFGRHYPSVYQVVRRLVTDEFTARDRTQAAFLSALSAIQRGQQPDNFRSWLLKIAVNEVRMGKRRPQPAQHDDPLFEMFAEVATESAELAAQRAEFERALELCLATMPEKLREPLVLHYYQELPLSEIGAILGCSKSTAQGRLDSAIRMLRQCFKTRGYGALVLLLPEYFPVLAPVLEGSSLVGGTAGLGGLIVTHPKWIGGIGVVALVLFGTMQSFVLGEGLMDTVPNAPDEIVAGGRRVETTNQSDAESRIVQGQPARTTGTTGRARIIDAVTGRPIEHFWIGTFDRTEGHQFSAPRFPHFGTWHAMHDALVTLPSVREVHDAEGRVDLPTASTEHQALFVLAPEHAVLFAFGAPFRTVSASDAVEPIFALQPIAHREVLVLDHDDEKPVVGARLTLHDTPEIDYVSRIKSTLGSSALTLPTNAATGLESYLDGRLRIPLLMSMAVYTGSSAAAKSGYPVPGPFMIHKPGYAYAELTSNRLVAEGTARIFLDAKPATLRLNVVDRAGNPVRAALTIQSPSRDAFEVDTVTDAVGSCTIAGLAPGATELRIYVPAEFPGGLEPGQLVRNGILWNLKPISGRDLRRVQLRAGAVTELTHQLGSSTLTTPTAVVFGTIERPTEGTTVVARYGQGNGGWNGRALAGADYEVSVEAGLATQFKSVYDNKDGEPTIEQLFTIPTLKAGQRFRLDLVPPSTQHLKRFKGHLDLDDAKNLPLPENIELTLVESRTGLAQTPEHTLIDEKTQVVDGAAFDCALAPGVYRILGSYRTSESSTTEFEFGRVELLEDRTDAVIHIPWVSRIRVKATDVVEGRPIKTHRDGIMSWIRATDGSRTGRHRTFLSPGRYEIHYIARGYQPYHGGFEVGRTTDTEVAVEMVPGQGAVFAGKVVDKSTGRPLNQSATITCNRSSDPDNGLWKELEMGRFEFRGLAAGDYVLRVQLATGNDTSQSGFRFHIDERQERRGLVIRLDVESRVKPKRGRR